MSFALIAGNLAAHSAVIYYQVFASVDVYITNIGSKMYKVLVLANELSSIISIGCSFMFQRKALKLAEKIKKCDDVLLNHNVRMDYKSQRKLVTKFIIAYLSVGILICGFNGYFCFSSYNFQWQTSLTIVSFMIVSTLTSSVVLSQMFLSAMCIFVRLRALNYVIFSHFGYNNKSPNIKNNKMFEIIDFKYVQKEDVIFEMGIVNLYLQEAILLVNQCLSFQVMDSLMQTYQDNSFYYTFVGDVLCSVIFRISCAWCLLFLRGYDDQRQQFFCIGFGIFVVLFICL